MFTETLALLEGHKLSELRRRLRNRGKLQDTYWVCCISINQHSVICSGFSPSEPEEKKRNSVTGLPYSLCTCSHPKWFSGDACEVDKFDSMMAWLCRDVPAFSQVVAVDEHSAIFTRAWCVAEL